MNGLTSDNIYADSLLVIPIYIDNINMGFYYFEFEDDTNFAEMTNVNNMFGTIMNCKLLTVAPIIPNGVTTLENTFNGCSALTNEGVPVIPSSVKYMSNTFSRCTTITDFSNIIIPSIVTSLSQTFSGCTSLVDSGMPIIPNTVTEMYHTFDGCTMLKDLSNL